MYDHNRQAARDNSRKEAALPIKERHDQRPPSKERCDPFLQIIAQEHFDHKSEIPTTWKQIGRCVYCSCGSRLFQGSLKTILAQTTTFEIIE